MVGGTGFGLGPSIAIDSGIIIADIIECLEKKGYIIKPKLSEISNPKPNDQIFIY